MRKWMICLMLLALLAGAVCPALADYEEDPARLAVNLQAIKVMLDANDLAVSYEPDSDLFELGFMLDNERLDACTIWLIAYEDGVEIEMEYDEPAEEAVWLDVAVFLNRMNVRTFLGNLYLDEDSGAVGYRVFLYGDVLPPTQNALETSLAHGLWMLERIGASMEAMLFEGATVDEAWALLAEE